MSRQLEGDKHVPVATSLAVQPFLPPGSLSSRVQPTLRAHDLLLRPWTASDASDVVRAYQDPDIQQWHARSMSEADAVAWLQSRAESWMHDAGAGWAVTDGGHLVGRVGLGIDLAAGLATVGYWVLPSSRGRGVATAALRAACEWAFRELGLHRLELEHATGNAASCAVANKSGFALEGTKRKQALHLDGWHDIHLHARLAEDAR